MNFGEANKYSRDIVAAYFGDSHVFYAEQKMAKRTVPYLTVKFNGLGKVRTKITKYDRENQCFKDYWQANTKMELNLYTLGKNIAPEDTDPQPRLGGGVVLVPALAAEGGHGGRQMAGIVPEHDPDIVPLHFQQGDGGVVPMTRLADLL